MNLVSFLIDALRGALILGIALAALPLVRRAPAAVRRALLFAALVAALVAPLFARAFATTRAAQVVALPFVVRQIHFDPVVEASDAPTVAAGDSSNALTGERDPRSPGRAHGVPWSTLLAFAWALGASGVVLHLGLGVRRARCLVRRARCDEVEPFANVVSAVARDTGVRADVAISDDVDAPAVAGLIRSVVLMPRAALGWSKERWKLVLLHEFAHVARRDCLAGAIAELACAMHWFDPLAWLARRRLRRERELAADEDVLAAGHLASDYAAHLLAIATASRLPEPAGALGMTAKPSELAERVEKLVAADARVQAPRVLLRGSVAAFSAMALALACANPRPASTSAARGSPPAASTVPTPTTQLGGGAAETSVPAAAVEPASLAQEVAKQLGVPAARVELTIAPALQKIVDEELAQLVAEHHPVAATAILLDPNKGEILAIGDAATARRAFVTGSTIKPFTAAAAIEMGAVRLEQKFDCRPRSIGARTIQDPKDRGALDISGIIEVSSNVGASRLFDAIGKDRFDEVLARFHLGDASAVELPTVARGEVPETARLDAYDGAMVAIGEGLTATPLHMVAAYGAFANRGEYVAPTLVRKISDDSGRTVPSRAVVRERVIREGTAQTVMQMLERAVNGEQATGKARGCKGCVSREKPEPRDGQPPTARSTCTRASLVSCRPMRRST